VTGAGLYLVAFAALVYRSVWLRSVGSAAAAAPERDGRAEGGAELQQKQGTTSNSEHPKTSSEPLVTDRSKAIRVQCLSHYKGSNMLLTCIAILAVDFQVSLIYYISVSVNAKKHFSPNHNGIICVSILSLV
jgi:hypothetical protein